MSYFSKMKGQFAWVLSYARILQDLFTVYARPEHNLKEFLIKYIPDLLAANIGFFLGFIFTAVLYISSPGQNNVNWYLEFVNVYWTRTVPLFSLVCAIIFPCSGLYGPGPRFTFVYHFFAVFRAVTLSLLCFVFVIFLLQQLEVRFALGPPRSSIVTGWFFAFVLMMAMRGARIIFNRHFVLLPRAKLNNFLNHSAGLEVVELETGWVPRERPLGPKGETTRPSENFALWPYFGEVDIDAAVSVLRSGKINRWTGEQGAYFEQEFAEFCGCRHAISVANGTLALELALHTLNIGAGDEVIVPCRTFIATASSVVMCGAKPVVVDIDRESQNLTPETIKPLINPRTKAIIAVHLAGWPCELKPILSLAKKHGIKLIEDCAQAHGATYKGAVVGSFGDIAAFSFCQDKIMTTGGEGGMVTTNDDKLWKWAWSIKDHGKDYDAVYDKSGQPGFRWLHKDFGTNFRMTEMQSAIGRTCLKKLPQWVRVRQGHASMLTNAFSTIPGLRVTVPPDYIGHSYYKYYAFIEPKILNSGWDRNRIMNAIIAKRIPCFPGICGQIHMEKAFNSYRPSLSQEFPVAKELMETSLMFLVHPTLTEKEITATISVVQEVFEKAVA